MNKARLLSRLTLGAVLVVVSLCACVPAEALAPATASRSVVPIRTSGRIGRLRIDRAGRSKVLAVKGEPAAEGQGNFVSGDPDFESLGYSCRSTEGHDRFPIDGDFQGSYAYCRTVYFINVATGRLAALFTSDPTYHGPRQTHPGMHAATAERRLHRRALSGCGQGISISPRHRRASLWFNVEGGRSVNYNNTLVVIGGRINWISLESVRHPVGLQFC
jgi:hypothetical protein